MWDKSAYRWMLCVFYLLNPPVILLSLSLSSVLPIHEYYSLDNMQKLV